MKSGGVLYQKTTTGLSTSLFNHTYSNSISPLYFKMAKIQAETASRGFWLEQFLLY